MTVTITLETMKFHAFHGVMAEERATGGTFLVDVSYTFDTNAVETDRLEDTVDYSDLYDLVKEEMLKQSFTIEHVAGRTLKAIISRFPQIQELVVKIAKLNPPVNGEMASASAMIKNTSFICKSNTRQ